LEYEIETSDMNEDELIDRALPALPIIGKRLFASLIEHPFAKARPHSQIKAMGHLFNHSPATLSEVAEALGISLPTASELIDRLVEEGIVSRDINPSDRRKVVLGLTPHAREMGHQIHEMRRAHLRAVMDRLEPEERPVFVKSLLALADVLTSDVQDLPGCLSETAQTHEPLAAATVPQTTTGEGR
jgi:DNA-binding MarR family transcriptional regulator